MPSRSLRRDVTTIVVAAAALTTAVSRHVPQRGVVRFCDHLEPSSSVSALQQHARSGVSRPPREHEPAYASDGRPIWRRRELIWTTVPFDDAAAATEAPATLAADKKDETAPDLPSAPLSRVQRLLELAFDAWSSPISSSRLRIRKARSVDEARDADIRLAFYRGKHGCRSAFDGPHSVLGHAYSPPLGSVHFDGDENWEFQYARRNATPGSVPFYPVALHEIGHALGLSHSDDADGIMFPWHHSDSHFAQPSPSELATLLDYYGETSERDEEDDETTTTETTSTTTTETAPPLSSTEAHDAGRGRKRQMRGPPTLGGGRRGEPDRGSDDEDVASRAAFAVSLRRQTLLLLPDRRHDGYVRFDAYGRYVGRGVTSQLFEANRRWKRTNAVVERNDGTIVVLADTRFLYLFDAHLRMLPGYPRRVTVFPHHDPDRCTRASSSARGVAARLRHGRWRRFVDQHRGLIDERGDSRDSNDEESPAPAWPGNELRLLNVIPATVTDPAAYEQPDETILLVSERGVWTLDARRAELRRRYASSCRAATRRSVASSSAGSAFGRDAWWPLARHRLPCSPLRTTLLRDAVAEWISSAFATTPPYATSALLAAAITILASR